MILSRIEIENYKQYMGTHDIEFPQDAVVGIIGDNGTGKTTLFEAIEWCLYSPRAISPADVRPRGVSGPTTVTAYLETADGREQWIVQRVLKRAPSASIYRIDQSGEMQKIVDGTRQVTDYVASTLIGLSHAAFTASFFTRQKELHLFGSETPAKRREAIGRMLGLETIRQARRSIMDDRQRTMADARAIRTQYERETMGRNFDLELASAQSTITASETDVAAATEGLTITAGSLTDAESALALALARRDRHVALAGEIAMRDRERASSVDRIAQIESELAQIALRETERAELAMIAARYLDLRTELERQEQEKSKFDLRTNLERTRSEIVNRQRHLIDGVAHTVSGIAPHAPVGGWEWRNNDDIDPTAGISRLIAVVDGLDVAGAEQRETNLRKYIDTAQAVTDAESMLNRYQKRRQDLLVEEKGYLANGEPNRLLPGLDREREQVITRKTTFEASVSRLEEERNRARILLGNLRQQLFGDVCPTCGRPFAAGDAEIVIAAIESRVSAINESIKETAVDIKAANADLVRIEDERTSVAGLQKQLDEVRSRITSSVGFIQEQESLVRNLLEVRQVALAGVGLASPPSPDEIRRAQSHVRDLQAIARTRASLTRAEKDLSALRERETATVAELATLADVQFDAAAFSSLREQTHAADRARAEVAQVDRELTRRPGLQTDLKNHKDRSEKLAREIVQLHQDVTQLGFDPNDPVTAQSAVDQAKTDAQKAQDHFHRQRTLLREAELQRDQVIRERARLNDLAILADQRQREADEFDLMSKEFMEFERFAGERKVPILNDTTSALVESITNGKYQRVEFDQDFGIRVFDSGEIEESFPVDTFSGGERDAIILAARLALSRMIGQQAANPPGFLVLDEVFGSLDSDRRSHLLGLLGSITSMFDDIRQVFIISHVDDVRTSPVLDEVWRVEENADGGSQVTALGSGFDLDEA